MLSKKLYTREEVENLYQVYSEKVKQHQQIVKSLNETFRDHKLDLDKYDSWKAVVAEADVADKQLERVTLIFKAVIEIAQNLICGEIAETFNSEVLAKFAGKSCGEKTYQKFRNLICEKYGIEYAYLHNYSLEWSWHNHSMNLYASENFVDGNNKFRADADFHGFKARPFPEDLEQWVDVFLAKKAEHEKLLEELKSKINSDCEELEIGYVQLPHIQVNALR